MDLEYDEKFEEMKKYIPFLERMIDRLESTSTSPKNPRQAQLDKIRSLRDLLLDKKKRMKMENLLKCEQVLINLYAKVEQKDTLPDTKKPDSSFQPSRVKNESPNLDVCRNKLKIVSSKISAPKEETLPDIARAGEEEIDCIPGSKEPALFHRRPNKTSISPSRQSLTRDASSNRSPTKNVPKRNYTRVLVSPEPTPPRWSSSAERLSVEKPLFSRRSPQKSPSNSSPYKKDKKSEKKSSKKTECKDLNITLNVPEESLSTLNKRDILSRIIECPNDDVDIKTLCDVKAQILRELKQSGSSEDISDLILKSYKVKKRSKKKEDIEEGELSDSESEAIESIYGSLVVVDKNKRVSSQSNKAGKDDKSQRKVQICLVLNSDKQKAPQNKAMDRPNETDTTDFEMFSENKKAVTENSKKEEQKDTIEKPIDIIDKSQEVITIEDDDMNKSGEQSQKDTEVSCVGISTSDNVIVALDQDSQSLKNSLFRVNFYKPLNEQNEPEGEDLNLKTNNNPDRNRLEKTKGKDIEKEKIGSLVQPSKPDTLSSSNSSTNQLSEVTEPMQSNKLDEEIPLLNTEPLVPTPSTEKNVLSEIDILQALKNEILSESIAIPGADAATPALHQPKVTKVASAQEITAKKRISIEKYKQKAGSTTQKSSLFLNDLSRQKSNDYSKKQSLRLTDEELQRFKFPPKLALEDSSDEELESISSSDIYGDLDVDSAPKSPENQDQVFSGPATPIIIPIDPIKPSTVSSKADVDMRKLMPTLSINVTKQVPSNAVTLGSEQIQEQKKSSVMDPRVKRDLMKPMSKGSPNSHTTGLEGTPRSQVPTPNMTPNSRLFEMTPSRQSFEMTPSRQTFEMTPSRQTFEMTPSRQTFEMTPSRQTFDLSQSQDGTRRKHVYAPLPTFESNKDLSVQREDREPRWEPNCESDLWKDSDLRDRGSLNQWEDRDRGSKGWSRNDTRDDFSYRNLDCPRTPLPSFGRQDTVYSRSDSNQPNTPVHPFGRTDCPTTPTHPFGRSEYAPSTPSHHFGRSECPMTPSHPFGRSECPRTPSHPFGRSEIPMTPSHQTGWPDMPMTPSHAFGRTDANITKSSCNQYRSDMPMTPSHPFGRSELPMTPSHPFGRHDAPRTPNHPFGQDYNQNTNRKDPRLSRNMEYGEDRDRGYQNDRRRYDYSHNSYNDSESYRNYDRDYIGRRHDHDKYDRRRRDRRVRTPDRDQGRGIPVSDDSDRLYTRDRGKGKSNDYQRDCYNTQEPPRDYQRAASVGRSGPIDEKSQSSSSRAPSIGITLLGASNTNTLSVTPQSGRSFTIDTSVNTTFQEFLSGKGLLVLEQSTDRRSRAASVGRSLVREHSVDRRQYRENSVGRTFQNQPKIAQDDSSGYKRMINFVRARSMGRDLTDERSLKDIKADFRSYRSKHLPANPPESHKPNMTVHSDPRNKKNVPQVKNSHKQTYSPRKNYRDPRMRKDQQGGNEKNKHGSKEKGFGIVYSSDNIAKGTILGPGYGVKNYKIPKIKRPVEQTEVVEPAKVETKKDLSVAKSAANNSTGKIGRSTDSKKKENGNKPALVKKSKEPEFNLKRDKKQDSDSKTTIKSDIKKSASSRKSEKEKVKEINEDIPKPRRIKKAVIESDSDTEMDSKSNEKSEDTQDTITSTKEKDDENIDNISLNASFGMDDLEIFPDNIATDPVMNITALIADLDNDIDTSKAEAIDFSNDNVMSFNTMLDKLEPHSVEKQLAESLDDISEVINEDMKTTADDNAKEITEKQLEPVANTDSVKERTASLVDQSYRIEKDRAQEVIPEAGVETETITVPKNNDNKNVEEMKTISVENQNKSVEEFLAIKSNTNAEVTTTEKETVKTTDEIGDDRCSTPDSTINNEMLLNKSFDEQGLPDSTIEKKEMHSDVTSTHELPEISVNKENSSRPDVAPLDSIGNLLSILKDKSKMQELLGMLGDDESNENEKIKKALEKISEIVSDDDTINSESKTDMASTSGVSTEKKTDEHKISDDNIQVSLSSENIDDETLKGSEENTESQSSDSKELHKDTDVPAVNTKQKNPSVKLKKNNPVKKNKKGKGKPNKTLFEGKKRITRSGANLNTEKPKKASRELKLLHESIKEMFISDDILNASGIRMCRLAKMVTDKNSGQDESNISAEPKPVVVLEKFQEKDVPPDVPKARKKPGPKPKPKLTEPSEAKNLKVTDAKKNKPGPKSKTKTSREEADPYSFDDSTSETTIHSSVQDSSATDSEDDSLASSKSFGSSEVLSEIKKKTKRKRRFGWQSGIIKKRKKTENKLTDSLADSDKNVEKEVRVAPSNKIPDMTSFTDKTYCFKKNISAYSCRLCIYTGDEIVKHYKTEHPHTEIPLSRMTETVARDAIAQCEDINFQAISQMITEKYICRFCFSEFGGKRNTIEEFFWHVVSKHTGEYKHLCSECVNVTKCPFNLDIPPPPKELHAQLIGYVCGKCNFTQISLENLKTHVIVRHNDEQTAVYTVNLSASSKKAATKKNVTKAKDMPEKTEARILRSSRLVPDSSECSTPSDALEKTDYDNSEIDSIKNELNVSKELKPPVHSKLTFENDDIAVSVTNTESSTIKTEKEDHTNDQRLEDSDNGKLETLTESIPDPSIDIMDCPHFKVSYNDAGTKEYICCINGSCHYKTTLLISMKKHVQIKHKEVWDGYCFICKVIVMPQGNHTFKECLQHCLDKHMDDFPIYEGTETSNATNVAEPVQPSVPSTINETYEPPNNYINVRPIAELISGGEPNKASEEVMPKIQSVVSLGAVSNELPEPDPSYSPTPQPEEGFSNTVSPFKCPSPFVQPLPKIPEPYKYEEWQAEVMAKKYRVILDTMLSHDKLVHIYKCAGTYCSYSTDSAEAAISHATAHQRIGGENSLMCAYCDYDCQKNAIDLVMHVFKTHGCCQYVCGHCFYRAIGCPLVVAHLAKVHTLAPKTVLKTATVSPIAEDLTENMLPREVAVQQYVCTDFESQCQFKTYTHQKFMAHLLEHKAAYYLCYICMAVSQTPIEIIEHMKCHGYRLYQCTWCIGGGDNESEFFAHTSAKHPSKEPQAYMRLIRNNKTLPLAKLINKTLVQAINVIPSETPGDPAKQAEKSLDLEKIIRWTALPNESSQTLNQNETSQEAEVSQSSISAVAQTSSVTKVPQTSPVCKVPQTSPVAEITQRSQMAEITQRRQMAEVVQTSQLTEVTQSKLAEISKNSQGTEDAQKSQATDVAQVSQATDVAQNTQLVELIKENPIDETVSTVQQNIPASKEDVSVPLTNALKKEPVDEAPLSNPVVICLDSDEETPEEPKQNVIDLSEDDPPPTSPMKLIKFYQCSKCKVKFKVSPGFKKHITVCLQGIKIMSCAHCTFTTENIHELYWHYSTKHGSQEKEDAKTRGKELSFVAVTTRSSINNEKQNTKPVATQKSKPSSKRKLSANNSDGITENPAKRKRYGPQDLDKLPQKPILDELAFCSECEFNTKVRLNLVRHFQQHAEDQNMVPQTAPVNPVPHLETNEKHFDKMINLASSSLETARQDKQEKQVVVFIPPEAASRYPKYVPDKQRHTCGAKGCAYISLDETMLKYHWETLHAGSNDFHCVHCPPYQHLDKSKPLTSTRIVTHLKMHDSNLYACSSCPYYHFKKQVVEKHLSEVHKGTGKMLIVREETTSQTVLLPQSSNPTMDLKPWKCGLCPYKSMLLPEVVDHCSKQHNTKMQYKCPVCPFRTSTLENVSKHKMKSHPGNTDDVFYFYYREGSIPNEPDGTPRWEKQRQKLGFSDQTPEVKTESATSTDIPATLTPILPTAETINLDIVKKEAVETEIEETIEELCKKFGEICDPNGIKYKCPLCKLVMADTQQIMQSHLYEELQYRKWGCNFCSYKGFHKAGLNEHMFVEHKQTRATEPIELPVDKRVERWVSRVLAHQTSLIETNKANLAKQKIVVETPKPTPSTAVTQEKLPEVMDISEKELDKLTETFGEFGSPNNINFCCPKCDFQTPHEDVMKDHLESELNKIRWRCSVCNKHSTNYHEAQLHCKVCASRKDGKNPQPLPTAREPSVRASWLAHVISSQKRAMIKPAEIVAETAAPRVLDNSLLVVRYEERIPTPEEEMLNCRKRPAPPPAADASPDSDEERLVIDEPSEQSKKQDSPSKEKQCQHCDFTSKFVHCIHDHQLRHYNLKPYTCGICDTTFYKYSLESHLANCHPNQPGRFWKTKMPTGPPIVKELTKKKGAIRVASQDTGCSPSKAESKSDEPKLICLICEKLVCENMRHGHLHDKPTYFGKKGDVVVKCCTCLGLFPDETIMKDHHKQMHPNIQLNYAFFKLCHDKREILCCGHCKKRFKFIRDLRTHHNVYHGSLKLKYETMLYTPGTYDSEVDEKGESSKCSDGTTVNAPAAKSVAKKSTTKLPSQTVARKSTTKLPFYSSHNTETEYSFYGTKPTPISELQNMTTVMSLGSTLVPVTVKQLSNVMNIDPRVVVKDCKK